MSLTPGVEISLMIEKPAVGGRMLARHDGQVVFVAGAIPGEHVRARIDRITKQVAFAEATEVLDPSADRRRTVVDWTCGGLSYAHIDYQRQLSLKSEVISDAFSRIAKIAVDHPVPVFPSAEHGYRMRARMHAQDGRFGFFREGTHELCDAGPTQQLLPETIDAVRRLEQVLRGQGIADVMSCEISENALATERTMLLSGGPLQSATLNVETIEGITGLALADQHRARPAVVFGSPYVTDAIDIFGTPATLTHHVQSFFQANRYLLRHLAERVVTHIAEGQVTDLYAGVGLFAVSLAAKGRQRIVAVEGDRAAARDLEANAAVYRGAISVEPLAVEDYLRRRAATKPDTLLLDPPRTGLSREALSGILGLKPTRIVYVSCDLATFARDIRRCVEARYRLDHLEAFDLFPNTAHVETLAVLTRS